MDLLAGGTAMMGSGNKLSGRGNSFRENVYGAQSSAEKSAKEEISPVRREINFDAESSKKETLLEQKPQFEIQPFKIENQEKEEEFPDQVEEIELYWKKFKDQLSEIFDKNNNEKY